MGMGVIPQNELQECLISRVGLYVEIKQQISDGRAKGKEHDV